MSRKSVPHRLLRCTISAFALAGVLVLSGCGGGGGSSVASSPDPVLAAQISDIKPSDPADTVTVFVELSAPAAAAAAATDPLTWQQLQSQFLADLQKSAVQAAAGVSASPSCDLSALGARIASAFKPASGAAVRIELNSCELDLLPRITNVRGVHVDIPLDLKASAADALALEVQRSFGVGGAWPTLGGNTADGKDRIVAVLDTGVEARHPALAGKILPGACFSSTAAGSASLCPNGQNVDTVSPAAGSGCGLGASSSIDLAGNRPLAIQVGCTHGTSMAGVIAMDYSVTSGVASNASVARQAKVLPVQVFSRQVSGSATSRISSSSGDLLAALEWLARQADTEAYRGKIVAVNMSLGGGSYSRACDGDYVGSLFKTAFANLRARGILPVVAAGNEGNRSAVSFPACVSNAVAVAASRLNHAGLASYSNFSAQVKVVAPGGDLDGSGRYSMPALCASTSDFDCWQAGAGTSPATAMVSAAVASLRSLAPTASLAAVEAALSTDLRSSLPSLAKVLTDPVSSLTRPALQINASAYSLLALSDPRPVSPATLYAIGGNSSGLAAGQGLTLMNNNADPLVVQANGSFVFAARLADGATYSVSVGKQPSGQTCSVSAGSGKVAGANIGSVSISCVSISANSDPVPAGCTRFPNDVVVCDGRDRDRAALPQAQLRYQLCVYPQANYQDWPACTFWNGVDTANYGYFGPVRSVRLRSVSFDAVTGRITVGDEVSIDGVFRLTLTPMLSRSEVLVTRSSSNISALLPRIAVVRWLKLAPG
jgi:hypothetical protein